MEVTTTCDSEALPSRIDYWIAFESQDEADAVVEILQWLLRTRAGSGAFRKMIDMVATGTEHG